MSYYSFPKETSCSPVDKNFHGDRSFPSAGLFFCWSELSDFRWVSDQNAALLLSLANASIFNKKQKKEKIRHSKLSLIRPNCFRKHLWSDPSALEQVMIRPNCARSCLWSDPSSLESAYGQTFQTKLTSDQTISRPLSRLIRPKLPPIRPSPGHHPDCSALELQSRPCNFGLGTHGCALDWVWS